MVTNSAKGGGVVYICEKTADGSVKEPTAAADSLKSADKSGIIPVSFAEAPFSVAILASKVSEGSGG